MPIPKPKQSSAPPDYSNVREALQRHFALLLTDDQIRHYSNMHPITKRDSRENVCDTIDRDLLIDSIVQDLLGADAVWPLNMHGPEYAEAFYPAFKKAALEKGIALDKKWDDVD